MNDQIHAEAKHGRVDIHLDASNRRTLSRLEALALINDLWGAVILSGDISDTSDQEMSLYKIVESKMNQISTGGSANG